MIQRVLGALVIAFGVIAIAFGAANTATPSRSFKFDDTITLDWYEANSNCVFKRGHHDYFLVATAVASSHYKNTPLRLVVRKSSHAKPIASTGDLDREHAGSIGGEAEDSLSRTMLMAKRCGDKPSWFVYDFAAKKYLVDGVRYRDAESLWLKLGMPPIRLIKASRPGRHLDDLGDGAQRWPDGLQMWQLARQISVPVLIVLAAILFNAMRLLRRRRRSKTTASGKDDRSRLRQDGLKRVR